MKKKACYLSGKSDKVSAIITLHFDHLDTTKRMRNLSNRDQVTSKQSNYIGDRTTSTISIYCPYNL